MASEKKAGRPTKYTEKLAAKICHRISCGESVRKICEDPKMPARSTVMLWAAENQGADENGNGGFSDRYARAVQARMYYHADELLDIADDGTNDWMLRNDDGENVSYSLNGEHVQRSRLRVDTRKWLLSKLIPAYAEKRINEHTGPDGGPVEIRAIERKVVDPSN